MEKRIEKKVNEYMKDFKNSIKDKIIELGLQDNSDIRTLLQYIYDKENIQFNDKDFEKKKRYTNIVSSCDRCNAKKANGDKCTRRKKEGEEYCGTHIKGTPYGVNEDEDNTQDDMRVELSIQNIQGIITYIDKDGNVYKIEDILNNKNYPTKIGKYIIEDGVYKFV